MLEYRFREQLTRVELPQLLQQRSLFDNRRLLLWLGNFGFGYASSASHTLLIYTLMKLIHALPAPSISYCSRMKINRKSSKLRVYFGGCLSGSNIFINGYNSGRNYNKLLEVTFFCESFKTVSKARLIDTVLSVHCVN